MWAEQGGFIVCLLALLGQLGMEVVLSLTLSFLHVSACWLYLLKLRPIFVFQEKLLAHSKFTFPKFFFPKKN